jgi:hypothetical protein
MSRSLQARRSQLEIIEGAQIIAWHASGRLTPLGGILERGERRARFTQHRL